MTPAVQIICGDALECLREIPRNSIELFVTSPPYGNLRTYGRHCEWNFGGIAKEILSALVPGGVCCWNEGDQVIDGSEALLPFEHALFFKALGFRIHDTMIYERLNFSHPERARYHSMFEYIFILSKGAPRTFNPIKDKKNATSGCVGNLGVNTFTERDGSKSERAKKVTAEFGMRGNVWRGKTRGQEEMCCELKHPAMMPRWLARDLILSWSNTGETVCDPFLGSGTVAEEALKVSRNAIGFDVSQEYCDLARHNCDQLTPGLQLA